MILMNGMDDNRAVKAAYSLDFVATEWDSHEEKEKCFRWLRYFMLAGCPKKKWRKGTYHWLYQHLFGHIAHYNIHGFWDTWFEREHMCHKWVDNITQQACYGDPEYTWSDVEVAIKTWLKDGNLERVHAAIKARFHQEMAKAKQLEVTQIKLWGGL